MNEKLFRKKSIDKISAPEQLNDYIKVSNPSVWVVLAAVFILLASLTIWSIFGTLPTTITAKGCLAEDGTLTCFISQEYSDGIHSGMKAKINGYDGEITVAETIPLSKEEAGAQISGDYMREALLQAEWNIPVSVKIDGGSSDFQTDKIYEITIVTEEVRPINFLFN